MSTINTDSNHKSDSNSDYHSKDGKNAYYRNVAIQASLLYFSGLLLCCALLSLFEATHTHSYVSESSYLSIIA